MRRVLVETNWVVDWAAPVHHRSGNAEALLDEARAGRLTLHVPAVSIVEAKRVIRTRFHPRQEANAIAAFSRALLREGGLDDARLKVVQQVCREFEARFAEDLDRLEDRLAELRELPGIEVYALSDAMLARSVELSLTRDLALDPFDNAILGAVLVRAREFSEAGDEPVFATLDAHLQPWDREGRAKEPLTSLYDDARVWVYGNFPLTKPEMPDGWYEGAGA